MRPHHPSSAGNRGEGPRHLDWRRGHRTLPEIEDWARALVRSLPPDQRQIAVVSSTAYPDILTDRYRGDRNQPVACLRIVFGSGSFTPVSRAIDQLQA